MLGTMRWFNEDRGDGMIAGEDGEGYQVLTSGFVGAPPAGRCAGLPVTFETLEPGQAVDVAPVEDATPRRARLRSHRVMRASS